MTLPSFFRSTLLLGAMLFAACPAPPVSPLPDGGKPDGGPKPTPDSGTPMPDGGLAVSEACATLNEARCGYLARCGLIEDSAQAQGECARGFEATWCGPLTWPSHVAKGALKYNPLKAAACAESFFTQTCSEWMTLADSCLRFLSPRVPLGQACYDGFAECTEGVCRGSSCPRTCQPRARLDDVCTVDGDCISTLYCKPSPFIPSVGLCTNYGTIRAPCESDPQCLAGLTCVMHECRPLPSPGTGCLEGLCSEAGFCDGTDDGGVCLARKQEGAPCLDGQCVASMLCDPIRSVCVRVRVSSGNLCTPGQQCPAGEVCLGGSDRMVGACHAPMPEGDPCLTNPDCEPHLTCQDADGGRTCQRRAELGAACDSTRACQSAAVCVASRCTALPLPGQSCAQTRACRWGLCRELTNVDGGAVCGSPLSAGQPCDRHDECGSGSCVGGTCVARCVP